MPGPTVVKKSSLTISLPSDILAEWKREAIDEGQARGAGRLYSPSATVERILREYFRAKKTPAVRPRSKTAE
jgi:hypothetical protein